MIIYPIRTHEILTVWPDLSPDPENKMPQNLLGPSGLVCFSRRTLARKEYMTQVEDKRHDYGL